ncbi:MAG: glycosyltransferase family 4 protein [Acidiferrobacterales bacterium]
MSHLALLTTSFPNGQPGIEAAGSFVADFAAELAQRLKITVVAPGNETDQKTQGPFTVHRFAVPQLPLSLLKPSNPAHWGNIIRTLYAGQKATERLVRTKDIDHILALWVLPSGYWARRAWKHHGIPYSVWALGSDIWTLSTLPIVKNVLQVVLRDSDNCFADGYLLKQDVECLSEHTCEFLPSVRKLPLRGAKAVATRPPFRLAFLGRWHPHKGVDLLVEALKLLDESDWHKIKEVRIAGGGPLETLVKSGCATLRAVGRPVTVRGYLDKAQAAELLFWADYLVLPSRIESIPVIFSDAMQAGCPLIATPVGDLPRLLNEYDVGILSAETSSHSLAAAIRSGINGSPNAFSAGLRRALKQFSVERACDQLVRTLNIVERLAVSAP